MSPTMKKILLIGGAAVVGFVVYKKMTAKKPAAVTKISAPLAAKIAAVSKMQFAKMATATTSKMAGDDVIAELGLEEQLGSLGGAYR